MARIVPGRRLHRIMRERVQVAKQLPSDSLPVPLEYVDANSGTRNDVLTPGGLGRVTGGRLKFDAANPVEGIFFLAGDGSVVRVELMVKSMPGEPIFNAPALSPGDYRLEVRASFNNNGDPRVGVLAETLTVSG